MYPLLLLMRLAHVLTALFWVGTVFFMNFFLYPAAGEAGPAAGAVMGGIVKRKLPQKMAAISGITILSGFTLYWLNSQTAGMAWFATRQAMVFGTGGVIGTIALLVAMIKVKPAGEAFGKISAAVAARGGPPTPDEQAQMGAHMGRIVKNTRSLTWLVIAAALLMSIARYVA